jgi:hypothetical protein
MANHSYFHGAVIVPMSVPERPRRTSDAPISGRPTHELFLAEEHELSDSDAYVDALSSGDESDGVHVEQAVPCTKRRLSGARAQHTGARKRHRRANKKTGGPLFHELNDPSNERDAAFRRERTAFVKKGHAVFFRSPKSSDPPVEGLYPDVHALPVGWTNEDKVPMLSPVDVGMRLDCTDGSIRIASENLSKLGFFCRDVYDPNGPKQADGGRSNVCVFVTVYVNDNGIKSEKTISLAFRTFVGARLFAVLVEIDIAKRRERAAEMGFIVTNEVTFAAASVTPRSMQGCVSGTGGTKMKMLLHTPRDMDSCILFVHWNNIVAVLPGSDLAGVLERCVSMGGSTWCIRHTEHDETGGVSDGGYDEDPDIMQTLSFDFDSDPDVDLPSKENVHVTQIEQEMHKVFSLDNIADNVYDN